MTERGDFLERLHIIAGQTTYREPIGGYGTRVHHIPAAHCLLVTLCGSRGQRWQPGPEVAMTLITGNDDKREQVLAWLTGELEAFDRRLAAKHRADLPRVTEIAYRAATGRRVVFDALDAELQRLVKAGACILESALDETISRCEDSECHA